MCGSSNTNCCCCPNAKVFQEKVCGNLTGGTTVTLPLAVWTAPAVNDYFQGTFEIFNAGPADITANVLNINGDIIGTLTVPAGSSISVSVNNPNSFEIIALPAGTHGKFCITLYKRLFA